MQQTDTSAAKKQLLTALAMTILWLTGTGVVQGANQYYVAPAPGGNDSNPGSIDRPFASLAKARDMVRTVRDSMTADIVVYLRGGEYALSSAFVLDERDSGTNGYRVIYRAYPAERPVLTGARRVTGWTLHDATAGVYKASAGTLEFRQLYVNGQRAIRARTPNRSNDTDMGPYYRHKGWDTANKAVVVNGAEIADWRNLRQVEFVARYQWHQQNMRIDRYVREGDNARIYFQSPERNNSAFAHSGVANEPYYFENAYEFLDAEGEWYLDTATDTVYYKPRAGEDLATADVIAPAVERLVQIQGTTNPVHDIQIQGLCFEYSTWMGPSSHGLVDYQACLRSGLGDPVFPGAVHVQNAANIRIEGNVFRHLGCQGVVLYSQTQGNAIIGNLFEDISANGIVVDPTMASSGNSTNDTIAHNYVRWCGRDYAHACGIVATYPAGLVVEHNEVRDCPYTGISVGWGWTPKDTALRDNKIRFNDVFRVCQLLCDGGGLYTLSKQPGTHVFENWFHEIAYSAWAIGSPVNGIFHDEYSSFMTTEHNVFTSIPGGNIREGAGTPLKITYINNDTQDPSVKDNAGPLPPYDAILRLGDDEPPRIVSVTCPCSTEVLIHFDEPVEEVGGKNRANYSINHGISVSSATLASDRMTVTLTTSPIPESETHTLTISNIRDCAAVPNTIRANTRTPFVNGILAWWRFDDGKGSLAADSSGNGHTGMVTAGTWIAGKMGGALELETNGGVKMNGPIGGMSAFTVSFWIYPHTHSDYNQGVGKDWQTFTFHTESSGAIYCGITESTRFTPADLPAGTLALNVWQHFVFTYDHGACAFYKNGVKLASKTIEARPWKWSGFGVGKADGAIDDLRIYGRVLPDAEIQALANPKPVARAEDK
jgi:hypothetical protein